MLAAAATITRGPSVGSRRHKVRDTVNFGPRFIAAERTFPARVRAPSRKDHQVGEAARPLKRGRPAEPQPRRMRPVGPDHSTDLARQIAEGLGKIPGGVYEARTTFHRRAPHDMLGKEGYSLVSNYFARRVLPYCLMKRIITPLQTAVLSNFIGRQDRGLIEATQDEVASEIGVGRTSVGPAIKVLCEKNLLRKVQRGVYQLNPRVAFNGNGDEQGGVLAELRALDLESKFPDELLSLFPLDAV